MVLECRRRNTRIKPKRTSEKNANHNQHVDTEKSIP